jgi:hypothetical protein
MSAFRRGNLRPETIRRDVYPVVVFVTDRTSDILASDTYYYSTDG